MKKADLLFFFLVVVLLSALRAADPFYLKLFSDGKQQVLQKKYAEAVDSLRIAEFGLQSEMAILRELYLYHALALYKLNKNDEAKQVIAKLSEDLGVKDLLALEKPKEIEKDLLAALTALQVIRPSEVPPTGKKKETPEKESSGEKPLAKNDSAPAGFNESFKQTYAHLMNNRLAEGEKGIKALRAMDRRNPLVQFLEGLLAYQKRDFAGAAARFESLANAGSVSDDVLATTLHYLCLAHYQAGEYGLTLFYWRQADQKTKNDLAEVITKINQVRVAAIAEIGRDFTRRDFDKLRTQFKGDTELCRDFLSYILDKYRYRTQYIKDIIAACGDQPECTDTGYVLLAADFFRSRSEIKQASEFVESTRFVKKRTLESVPVLMLLGELYFDQKKYGKARDLFKQVKELAPSADVERWLKKIENAIMSNNQG